MPRHTPPSWVHGRLIAAAALGVAMQGMLPCWAQTSSPPDGRVAASAVVRGAAAAGMARVTDSEGTTRATVVGDSLWDIVGAVTAGTPIDRNQAMVAILRRNPEAFPTGNLHRIERNRLLAIPSLREMRAEDARRAAALVEQHRAAYTDRSLAPMPLYALAEAAPASAMASSPSVSAPGGASAAAAPPVSSAIESRSRSAASGALIETAPGREGPTSVEEPGSPAPAAPASRGLPWLPVVVLAALGGWGVWLLVRRRALPDLGADPEADAAQATRAFADSRLALEDQIESQLQQARESRLGQESLPLYASFEDDEGEASSSAEDGPALRPRTAVPLVRHADDPGTLPRHVANDGTAAGGEALALALTVAHAYADVGRTEVARRWLRAIDSHGGVSF